MAKVGALVFAIVIGLPALVSPLSVRASVMVAGAATVDVHARSDDVVARRAGSIRAATAPLPEIRVPRRAPLAVTSRSLASFPAVREGRVLASWYGPGFYGNRTACGHTFSAEIVGVAHRTFPCGTLIRITSPAGMTVTVPVIDRGPYVAGRELDLSAATKAALACADLCWVHMATVEASR